MSSVILAVFVFLFQPSPEAARYRARAALALAFADVRPPTYPEQSARALRQRKPLVVWVGQPARPVSGCLGVACDTFAGVEAPAVVVGLPMGPGTLRRVDLPGRPSDEAIRAAVRTPVE